MTIFESTEVSAAEAEAAARNYTPSHQETSEETTEVVDRSPLSSEENDSLHRALNGPEPVLNDQLGARAPEFHLPGEWVHPSIRARRKRALTLPPIASVDDLESRISAVLRFEGMPKEVAEAASKARAAVGEARAAHQGAQSKDNCRFATTTAAKDKVVQAIARATTAVAALEHLTRDPGVQDTWFSMLTEGLEAKRKAAAKATEAAARAYADWRQTIAAADALAREQGRYSDWHHHPDERELNPLGLIGELRRARDIATSEDDWVSGTYLVTNYNGVPPHTMAYLEDQARRAPGSFAESVLLRVRSPHPADSPVADALRERDLRIIHTSAIPALTREQEMWEDNARLRDPARD